MPYIGQRPSKGDENNFKILDDISSYTLTFDGSDAAVVSAANDTITSLNHRFVQGQRVTYNKGGGTVITGLSDGVYYIIKHDHHNIKLATSASNAANGTAVNITNVGSGSSHTLNAAFDGINTKFKATHTSGQKAKITRSAQLVISMNGVIQQPHDTATPSTGFGFDLDGTIVFSQAPVSTDVYWAHVLTNNNVTFDISDNDVDNFTGNGSTVSFNLSKTPPDNRNVLVTVDGVVQYPNDPDGTVRAYTVVENVLTFTTAPATGTEIQVRHIGFAGSTSGGGGSGVTNFYGRTGSVVLKNTDDVTVNDAAVTGDLTVTGNLTVNGTTTTLDTQLVEVDKIEVETAGTNVAVAVTHNGSGDLIRLYDGASQVVTIDDEGKVGLGSAIPAAKLDVFGQTHLDNVSIAGVTTVASDKSFIIGSNSSSQYNIDFKQNSSNNRNTIDGYYLDFKTADLQIRRESNNALMAYFWPGEVAFYASGGKKLSTVGSGIKVHTEGDGHGIILDNTTYRNNITAESNRPGAENSILEIDGKWNNTQVAFMTLSTGDDTTNKDDGRIRFFTKPSGGTIAERLRIEPDGAILMGGTSSRAVGFEHRLQIEEIDANPKGVSIIQNSANAFGAHIDFAKTRGSTRGSNTIVQDDDHLGQILWRGADGTDVSTIAAAIRGAVDGTPGANNIPGRLEFYTSSSGSFAEKLRILSDGTISYRTGGGKGFEFNSSGSSASVAANVFAPASYTLAFGTNGNERARINSTGQLIVGSTSSNAEAGTNTRFSVCATGSPGSNPSSILNNVIATFRATGAAGHAGSIAVLAGNDGSSSIHFGDTDNDIIGRIIYNHTSSNATDYMAFYVQGNERLQISAGGVLGVRTTPAVWHTDRRAIQLGGASLSGQNPADGQELSLTNNAFYDSADNRWEFIADDDANGIFMSNGGISFRRSPSSGTAGNVLNWATSLQINDTGYVQTKSELWVGGSSPVLRWRDTTHGEKATARIGGSDLYFEINNSEKLRIKSGTNPVEIKNFTGIGLHMSGAGDPTIRVEDTDGTNQFGEFAHNGGDSYINTRNNTSHGEFLVYSQNGSETKARLKIDSNGLMGLGVTPTSHNSTTAFQIYDDYNSVGYPRIRLTNQSSGTASSDGYEIVLNGSDLDAVHRQRENADIYFIVNNSTEALRISSDGTVSMGQVDGDSTSALHIRSLTSAETTLELSTKSNYNGSLPSAKISFTQQNGTEIARIKCDTHTGAANMADLVFWTNLGGLYERMRITRRGHIVTGGATPPSQAADDGSLFLKNGATLGWLAPTGSLTFNAYYNGGWKYVADGTAHIMWGSSEGINFSLASSGTAGNGISFSRAMRIHTNNRISIGDGNNTTPLAALHINTKAAMGTDTALWIGDNANNRYMTINQVSNSEQFSHMELRFNDNGRRNLLYLSNPYGPAGYGSGILWRGYNNGTQAYIETASEGANSANSTMKIYSSGNSGIDITHNSGVYIREPTSLRGVHITGHSSAQNSYESGYIQATSTGTYANIDIAPKGTRGQINFGGHGSQSIYLLVEGGSIDGNQTLTFDYSWYPGGAGGLKISAWASHWTSQYSLIRDAYVFGDSYAGMTEEVIKSKTSTEQGAWTFSRPSNNKFRIEKSAGTYGGGMNYCIMIWHPGNSMTLRRDT